jgi:hypothetical protein
MRCRCPPRRTVKLVATSVTCSLGAGVSAESGGEAACSAAPALGLDVFRQTVEATCAVVLTVSATYGEVASNTLIECSRVGGSKCCRAAQP